jgi:serine/threonine-protein kinase
VVPNVVGKTVNAAKRALAAAHCKTGTIKKVASKKVNAGKVISESPKAGKHLANGARVSLLVSRGRKRAR